MKPRLILLATQDKICKHSSPRLCLAKPFNAEELRIVIEDIMEPKLQLEAA